MGTTVVGSQHDSVLGPQPIGVLRVCGNAAKVPAALPDTLVACHLAPGRACVVRAVEPALIGFAAVYERVDSPWLGRARRQADPCRRLRESVARKLVPRPPTVIRFVKSAARAVRGRIGVPRRASGLPHCREDDVRISGLKCDVDRSGIGILVECLGPGFSAIGRAEDAALLIWTIRVPESRDEHYVRIGRMDEDLTNLLRIREADFLPS